MSKFGYARFEMPQFVSPPGSFGSLLYRPSCPISLSKSSSKVSTSLLRLHVGERRQVESIARQLKRGDRVLEPQPSDLDVLPQQLKLKFLNVRQLRFGHLRSLDGRVRRRDGRVRRSERRVRRRGGRRRSLDGRRRCRGGRLHRLL